MLCYGRWNARISKNLINKELNDEKLGRKRFGKFTERFGKKFGEKSNVKMGKSGKWGQYMVKGKN
jgi:hypothetical protein